MQKWNNSKDGLPKKSGRYLAVCGSVFIALFSAPNKKWVRESDREQNEQVVTHWMDLPKPP
jgi:hypothetical protein